MTKTEEVLLNKQAKDADRAMQEKTARIAAHGRIASAGVKAGSDLLSKIAFGNDPEWYKKWVSNLEKYTNLTTAYTIGTTNMPTSLGVPGVFVLSWTDCLGPQAANDCYGESVPINNAMERCKAEIRKLNSRMEGYEDVDLFKVFHGVTLMLEMEKLLATALQAWLKRDSLNGYLNGYTLITALGFNPSDFNDNIAKYRELYEEIHSVNVKEAVLPSGLSYVNRKLFMTGLISFESEEVNSGIYVAKPAMFPGLATANGQLCFVYTASGIATSLRDTGLLTEGLTYYRFRQRFNQYKQAFVKDVSFSSMLADLRSAFTVDKLEQLEHIDTTIELFIPYIPEANMQFENASVCVISNNDIVVSSKGYLMQCDKDYVADIESGSELPGASITNQWFAEEEKAILNFHKVPDGDDVLEATRLVAFANDSSSLEDRWMSLSGSEVINGIGFIIAPVPADYDATVGDNSVYLRWFNDEIPALQFNTGSFSGGANAWNTLNPTLQIIELSKRFYSFPIAKVRASHPVGPSSVTNKILLANIDVFARPSRDEIAALHQVAIKSLMYIDVDQFRHNG